MNRENEQKVRQKYQDTIQGQVMEGKNPSQKAIQRKEQQAPYRKGTPGKKQSAAVLPEDSSLQKIDQKIQDCLVHRELLLFHTLNIAKVMVLEIVIFAPGQISDIPTAVEIYRVAVKI